VALERLHEEEALEVGHLDFQRLHAGARLALEEMEPVLGGQEVVGEALEDVAVLEPGDDSIHASSAGILVHLARPSHRPARLPAAPANVRSTRPPLSRRGRTGPAGPGAGRGVEAAMTRSLALWMFLLLVACGTEQ